MSPRRRAGRKLFKTLLPVVLLLVLGIGGVVVWMVKDIAHPPRRAYLVTPEQFARVSERGLRAVEETWSNADGTQSRGWLLRGGEGAPAVIFLHHYGANRSWFFNLGVKLNEATNYTILWPDLRAHGENPPVEITSLGTREAEDVAAAISFLRSLKSEAGDRPLVGKALGLYGVELGAYAALVAASRSPDVRSLVLDSVPASPDALLQAAARTRTGLDNSITHVLTRLGARAYYLGNFESLPACEAAARLADRQVLLLTGADADYLRDSTIEFAQCLTNKANVQVISDLPLTGSNSAYSTGVQGEAYDRRIIEFLDRTLGAAP